MAHQNVATNVVVVEEVGNKPTTTHPNVATCEKLSEIFTTRRFPVSPGSVFHRKQLDVEIHKEKLNSQSDPNLILGGGATDVRVSDATCLVNITDKEPGELEDSDEDLTGSSDVSTIRSFDDLIRIEKDDLALRPLPVAISPIRSSTLSTPVLTTSSYVAVSPENGEPALQIVASPQSSIEEPMPSACREQRIADRIPTSETTAGVMRRKKKSNCPENQVLSQKKGAAIVPDETGLSKGVTSQKENNNAKPSIAYDEEVHSEKTKESRPSVPDGIRSKASKSIAKSTESVSRGRPVTDKLEKVGTNMGELEGYRIRLKSVQLPRPVSPPRVLSLPQSESYQRRFVESRDCNEERRYGNSPSDHHSESTASHYHKSDENRAYRMQSGDGGDRRKFHSHHPIPRGDFRRPPERRVP